MIVRMVCARFSMLFFDAAAQRAHHERADAVAARPSVVVRMLLEQNVYQWDWDHAPLVHDRDE
jgi:hypothetical protein